MKSVTSTESLESSGSTSGNYFTLVASRDFYSLT